MKLPRPVERPRGENTIALINIVFLMLIFFLIAGSLAPPIEGDVELIKAADAKSIEPPRALFLLEDGTMKYEGDVVTPEDFIARVRLQHANQMTSKVEDDSPPVRLAADGQLPAAKLIEIVDLLKAEGAGKITVITERKTE
ncbi:MAG: biopolymer transporter ExbD [Pseudomonadota bacterium]